MPAKRLKEFLDSHNVKYVTVKHSLAYTAQEIAESAHISGRELAKTIVIRIDGKMAMAVLPASRKLNLDLLRQAAGVAKVELAAEWEFKDKFPGCDLGAMPPFGNLYRMDVLVAEELAADKEIAFNAGSHTELIRMSYKDFENLVRPRVVRLSSAPWLELGS
jgi:Ala-tRNA(Pro) deacylase